MMVKDVKVKIFNVSLCLGCGGGYYGENVPSISPTVSNAPSLSDPPTLEPSIPPPPCMDVPGWKDRTGTRCSWYAQSVRMDDYYDDGKVIIPSLNF